jgi:hypothetical protein
VVTVAAIFKSSSADDETRLTSELLKSQRVIVCINVNVTRIMVTVILTSQDGEQRKTAAYGYNSTSVLPANDTGLVLLCNQGRAASFIAVIYSPPQAALQSPFLLLKFL